VQRALIETLKDLRCLCAIQNQEQLHLLGSGDLAHHLRDIDHMDVLLFLEDGVKLVVEAYEHDPEQYSRDSPRWPRAVKSRLRSRRNC